MTPVELPTLPLVETAPAPSTPLVERDRLVRRAKALAWLGVGWHGIEAAIAVGAGLVAGSIALIGFGADSLVEALAGFIVLWRFATARVASAGAERRAQQLIAASFFVIAAYVTAEAIPSLVGGDGPPATWAGIGPPPFPPPPMPPPPPPKP